MISVKLPAGLEVRLEQLAELTGRTKTYYVIEAVAQHIEDMEDRYLAFQRLARPMKSLSMEEARDEPNKMDS